MQAAQPNRLIHETSPYLLQHAYNPVRWYSWGAEAFDRAKAEDKPVFLSIGYSTCHWCHVMAHESFEDEEVARILDEGFIAVKVDKEERPDIDSVYMSVCQALTGQGGWPLTLLLTPEQKPFYAATYLPKRARGGMPGLMELLSGVMRGWEDNRPALLDAGEEIVRALRRDNEDFGGEGLSRGTLHKALLYFQNAFDPIHGGFGSAPKFPTPHNLLFLLRMHASEGEEKALNMVNTTLRSMVRGGIFDHIGGGFSRYSTDRKWLVPHFEKMLYDNALLAMAYLEAFQITEDPLYEWTARRIFAYTQRELRHPEGGFFCAQDADSEGVEGKYYVFSPDELEPVLGGETALFCRYFDITQTGNFEGQSIPNRLHAAAEVPGADIARLCEKAEAYRRERTSLHKDDKILVSWNALMIAALSKAYRILGDERCLEQAGEAAGFIEKYLMEGECLYVSFRDGKSAGQGHLDDYAFLAWGYLELFDASGDPDALEKAIRLTEVLHKEFHDPKDGGFYLYSHSGEQLIARPKEIYDGAIPSGNSAAAYVLTRIAQLTGEPKWLERARRQMDFLGRNIESFPGAYTFGLMAAMQTLYFSREIVVFAKDASDAARARRLVNSRFHPNTALLLLGGGGDEKLKQLCPFLKDYTRRDNETTVYLCRNNACAQPFTGLEKLEKELQMESGPQQ